MNNSSVVKKDYNYGLALLKVWMCFEVILTHFMNWGNNAELLKFPFRFLNEFGTAAVPCFMIMAFILTDVNRLADEKKQLFYRIRRLAVPQVFWAFVYWGGGIDWSALSHKDRVGDRRPVLADLPWSQ